MKTSRARFLIIILLLLTIVIGVFPFLQDYFDSKENLYGKDTQLEAVLKQKDISAIPDEQLVDFARILLTRQMSEQLQPYLTELAKRPEVGKWFFVFKYRDILNGFRYDEAFGVISEWISAYPDDPMALLRYSEHVLESDPESALNAIEKAKANSPQDTAYYDKLIATIKDFIKLKQVNPIEAYALFLDSEFYPSTPMRIKYLEQLVHSNEIQELSGYGKYYIELGNLYSNYGLSGEALEAYEDAESYGSNASAYKGIEYFKKRDKGGIDRLVVTVSQDSSEGLMLLGIKELISGNYENSCSYFENSLTKDSDNILNHYLLVYSYDSMGKEAKAMDSYVKFIEAYNKGNLPFSYDYCSDLLSIQKKSIGDSP